MAAAKRPKAQSMATRGRKPAPIELKLLKGNPGKRAINGKAAVLQQPEALAQDAAPEMLLPEAQAYWEHAIANAPRGLLRKLDVYLLAAWCNAAYRYEYNMRLAAKSDVIPVRGAKLAGLDPKDRPVMHNPFSTAARAYLKDMTMLASELGFTPSSRARLGAREQTGSALEDPWAEIAG
jgi:P27 family predicted phage terminase small subunit